MVPINVATAYIINTAIVQTCYLLRDSYTAEMYIYQPYHYDQNGTR